MIFPDWWKGFLPDREFVVMDLLQPFLDQCESDTGTTIGCDTRLPDELSSHLPFIRVYRGGGAGDVGVLTDPAAVQLGVIGVTRSDSWELMNFCRALMWTYRDGGSVLREDGSHTYVDSITEMTGPQQIPELNPDHRLVPLTFRVTCRPPRGLPNYKQIRESITG